LLPLARAGELNSEVHINATTGSTGAGQSLSPTSHFSWRNNNLSVYKPFEHQHLIEINQSLRRWQHGFDRPLNFIPLRGNFTRGILASMYLDSDLTLAHARELFHEYYRPYHFVHLSHYNIDLKQVVNTNKGLVYLEKHRNKLLVISVIDNLLKGASGQAVQNMNLMFGLSEQAGLDLKATAF
jgi:N-acetyl-gamma-glutamyl-phosphate reductase